MKNSFANKKVRSLFTVIIIIILLAVFTAFSFVSSRTQHIPGACANFFSYNAPSTGELNIPTFIVTFADTEDDPSLMSKDGIESLLYDADDPKSFTRWMYRASYGQLRINGEVFSYRAEKKMKDYEGKEEFEFEPLAEEVLKAFDDEIDYSEYDADGDGAIDAFILNIIGADDYFYGTQNTWYKDQDFELDGVWPANFIIDDAQPINTDEDREYYVQVAAHEFSHCMGLPDLYNQGKETEGDAMNGIAGTEMMDDMYGDLSQFSKLMLGWLKAGEVRICREGGKYYLPSSARSGGCVIIPRDPALSDTEVLTSEFFILQYDTAEGNMESVLTPADEGVRIMHCEAEVIHDEYGDPIFRYDDKSPDYDHSHEKQRIMRLVNDGGDYLKHGDDVTSSTPGFAWYDENGKETVDPGFTVHIGETDEDGAVVIIEKTDDKRE